jgi:DNA-binding NarL/FixJ family response regulator
MNKMVKIVIVDDHQIFLDGLKSVLEKVPNFEILFIETDSTKAFERIKNSIPDIIITDISMPIMNGIELSKKIKLFNPKIKILALTMFNNFQKIDYIDGYLLKETDKVHLIDVIKSIVFDDKKIYTNEYNNLEDSYEFSKSILSDREKDIIKLIANEYNSEEIAKKLFISKLTVETHRKNIFLKLKVKNIAGLVKAAMSLGII